MSEKDEEKRAEGGSTDRLKNGWPLPEGARRVPPDGDSKDEVDEAVDASFPASDPPSSTPEKPA